MPRSICIIDGHPDPDPGRLIHALADAYVEGAQEAGHRVSRIRIADLDVALLDSVAAFAEPPSEPVYSERTKIAGADHLVIMFPLWLGGMPARLRCFFEQAARGGYFLAEPDEEGDWPRKMMSGKSAHTIITMGMPDLAFRFMMDGAGLKALERGILGISGFKPLKHTVLGGAGALSPEKFVRWREEIRVLGRKGA